jgi:hypothetical protein
MRELIVSSLATSIEPKVAEDIVDTFLKVVSDFRKGDIDSCLTVTGRFVDHTLRAVEYIRTGSAPLEIKSVAQTINEIRKDSSLKDELRYLIPGIAGAIYDVRSKRGVVHVKAIDPRNIDAAMCVSNASWIVAELVRLYHDRDEEKVTQVMQSLMRGQVPLIEQIGPDTVVTTVVSPEIEVLLLLRKAAPNGLNRHEIGAAAKCSAVNVTRATQKLSKSRYIVMASDKVFRITGPGELHLANELAKHKHLSIPATQ